MYPKDQIMPWFYTKVFAQRALILDWREPQRHICFSVYQTLKGSLNNLPQRHDYSRMILYQMLLTHKAPPKICSRRQFQILLLFQK